MKKRLNVMALTVLTVLAGAPAVADDNMEPLTIVSWGGVYEESQIMAYFDPFTETTGIPVRIVHYDGGLDELRLQAEREVAEWDVMDMTMADNAAACEQNLLTGIDHTTLPTSSDGIPFSDDLVDDVDAACGVVQIVYGTVIGYNRNTFKGDRPDAIADLFDIVRFPGKRALQKNPETNLEWALYAYGVPRQDLYSLLSTERGLRLAFRQLDAIRDHIVWWTDPEDAVALLSSGDVAFASSYNGRLFDASTVQGLPVEIIWDGQVYEFGTWAIVKNSGRQEDAMKFIRFATSPERMAEQTRYISYSPARLSALPLVDEHESAGIDMRYHMPTWPGNFGTAIRKDTVWHARLHDRIRARFNDWLAE